VVLLLLLVGTAASRRLARAMHVRTTRAIAARSCGRAQPPVLLGSPSAERTFDGHPVPSPGLLMHPHSDFAHRYWADALQPGDTVVDATLGNGHDATFLALALGRVGGGRLVCMDVQPLALERSQERMRHALEADAWAIADGPSPGEWRAVHAGSRAELLVAWQLGCHASLLQEMAGRTARLVVFNLGYLPGGDKALCTQSASTVAALEASESAVMIGESCPTLLTLTLNHNPHPDPSHIIGHARTGARPLARSPLARGAALWDAGGGRADAGACVPQAGA
jgi:hypothetical protein